MGREGSVGIRERGFVGGSGLEEAVEGVYGGYAHTARMVGGHTPTLVTKDDLTPTVVVGETIPLHGTSRSRLLGRLELLV